MDKTHQLHTGIKDIIQANGVEPIRNIQLANILADYSAYDEYPATKVVLKDVLTNGFGQKIYDAFNKSGKSSLAEIEKIKLSETVIKEPIDRIVQIQRNITSRAGSTIVNSNNNGTTKIFKVTAYCSCAKCCGKTTGITASGTKATAGRTVAASGQFAFGTKLIINGQEYTVEDRGGAIQGNRIDVYMNSHAEALAWGVKYLPVQVAE